MHGYQWAKSVVTPSAVTRLVLRETALDVSKVWTYLSEGRYGIVHVIKVC